MQKEAYRKLYQVENSFWYHDAVQKLTESCIESFRKEFTHQPEILDIGSGTGGMFKLLARYGKVTGLELSEFAVQLCRQKFPHISIKFGSANNLLEMFPKASFDLVTLFNVLYHKWIFDDNLVLRQVFEILRPGGYIILVEPAFKYLYRHNDKLCYGLRRYSRKEVTNLLSEAGFSLFRSTYFNSISFIPLIILTSLERFGLIDSKNMPNELRPPPKYINNCMKWIMSIEKRLIIHFGRIPCGVSVLSVARKNQQL